MTIKSALKSAPPIMTVCVIMLFICLNALGVWQLQRLKWKQDMTAEMTRTQSIGAQPVREVIGSGKDVAWRQVSMGNCFIQPDKLIYMHGLLNGVQGYHVLGSCPFDANHKIITELGFVEVPLPQNAPIITSVIGRLRKLDSIPAGMTPPNVPSDNEWYWRSSRELSKALDMPLREDYFVIMDLEKSGLDIPGMVQSPMTAPLTNRHLEYALTWFGLAWTLLAVFAAVVFQKYKKVNA
ncbi:SURF1 family protein [Asticcacaulis machinosus]|uniref:SURF1-like protein n=1 Tax=Asticcacaulis machinosus TaxID=2984211 RepID=A0ABT5HFC0_9CAUL|nr:SURF1 family cytochrome oxidase biogenesis protein [Asticcacaulis machinosus]MDC7674954.1 SURF1 family protein [Asticcacaulis machinosus]